MNKKPAYKSKVNWLFVALAILNLPELQNILTDVPYALTVISTLGVVVRTFFTSEELENF